MYVPCSRAPRGTDRGADRGARLGNGMVYAPCSLQRTTELIAALRACSRSRDLEHGRWIYEAAVQSGEHSDVYVATALMNMFAKCGSMQDARRVFDSVQELNVVCWNVIILGYADNGEGHLALSLFLRMRREGCVPNARTLLAAVKACAHLARKEAELASRGKKLCLLVLQAGCDSDIYVQSALIHLFANSGFVEEARHVFESTEYPNVVAWTAIVLGYAENGQGDIALDLLYRMALEGCAPNEVTFLAAVKACIDMAMKEGSRQRGKALHMLILRSGCDSDSHIQSSLLEMYATWGCMEEAEKIFKTASRLDVVTWTVLIFGYAENGQGKLALSLFLQMRNAGCEADAGALVSALKACIDLSMTERASARRRGRALHLLALACGLDSDARVQNTLVDVYAKCGSLEDAQRVFDRVLSPGIVSWTVLILGYAENGQAETALDLFRRMGCAPNEVTYLAALKACGTLGALEIGKELHAELCRRGFSDDGVLVNCLVDFYAKCGSLSEAEQVFESHTSKSLVTWNALMGGYTHNGDTASVFGLLERMQQRDVQPDAISFMYILTACSHGGLVDKGKEYFESMSTKYGVQPDVEHCNCIVDTLGRADRLNDAMAVLRSTPLSPNSVTWMTVLGACEKWRNLKLGELAFQCLCLKEDIESADGAYVAMASLLASKCDEKW